MPAANSLRYFPLHVDDYLNDPAVLGMDADAEGCYVRLLLRSWRSATPGRIPDRLVFQLADGWRLALQYRAIASDGCDAAGHLRWDAVEAQISAAFDLESTPGFWLQKRMVLELRRAQQLTNGRRKGAATTNTKRNILRAERTVSARLAVGILDVDVDVDKKKTTPSTGGVDRLKLPDWLPGPVWEDWCTYRRSRPGRAPWTRRGAEISLATLATLHGSGHDPRSVVEQSILNGWRGLFELRSAGVGKTEAETW